MTIVTQKHLVVLTSQLWGHARTACTLVARVVKMRNISVTFFTGEDTYDRVKAEIMRDILPGQEHLLSCIRLIGLEGSKDIRAFNALELAFEAAWNKMLKDEPVICAKTGTRFDAHPIRPTAALLDLFVVHAFDVVKSSSSVKVYNWYPAAVQSLPLLMQAHDLEHLIHAEAERRGVPREEVMYEMMNTTTGRVIHSPCAPSMYDYEYHPQAFPLPPEIGREILTKVFGTMQRADGLVTLDSAEYCPEATKALREWMAQTSRKAFFAGPLIPQNPEDTSGDPRSRKILNFLDEKLASHGKHSVIYVSFGSLFFPPDHAKLWAVLEVIMEKDIPFVISGASALDTQGTASMREKIATYGNVITTNWVPQQALLDHPATGWFLSHGGHNSTIETIVAGVPMIVWPIDADQPVNAIQLAENLDVAYELIEVRRGTGAGKIYRNGRTPVGTIEAVKNEMRDVLEHAFGGDGARKREKLQMLRKVFQTGWQDNGIGRQEVEAFLDDL